MSLRIKKIVPDVKPPFPTLPATSRPDAAGAIAAIEREIATLKRHLGGMEYELLLTEEANEELEQWHARLNEEWVSLSRKLSEYGVPTHRKRAFQAAQPMEPTRRKRAFQAAQPMEPTRRKRAFQAAQPMLVMEPNSQAAVRPVLEDPAFERILQQLEAEKASLQSRLAEAEQQIEFLRNVNTGLETLCEGLEEEEVQPLRDRLEEEKNERIRRIVANARSRWHSSKRRQQSDGL